jgi:hypothetical protein
MPIYDTETGEIIHRSPGIVAAWLKWDNASKTYFSNSIRGRKGRYLPAEEAPVKEQPAVEEKKPATRKRTARKTNTNK